MNEALSLARAQKERCRMNRKLPTPGLDLLQIEKQHALPPISFSSARIIASSRRRKLHRLGMALYAKGDAYHAKQTLRKALDLTPILTV
jgi:hypothetical protein